MDVLERYFQALRGHDWVGLGDCLAADVCRSGPYLDVVRGTKPTDDIDDGFHGADADAETGGEIFAKAIGDCGTCRVVT